MKELFRTLTSAGLSCILETSPDGDKTIVINYKGEMYEVKCHGTVFTVYGEMWDIRGIKTGDFSFDTDNESEAFSLYEALCDEENIHMVGLDENSFNVMECWSPGYGF